MTSQRQFLNVEIDHFQRVVLDEIAARFDDIAHQGREHVLGLIAVFDPYLQQRPYIGIERRLPELFGIHFPQPLVTLNTDTLAAKREHSIEQFYRTGDPLFEIPGAERCRTGIENLEIGRYFVQPARFA